MFKFGFYYRNEIPKNPNSMLVRLSKHHQLYTAKIFLELKGLETENTTRHEGQSC
jgi:hypothetical protein